MKLPKEVDFIIRKLKLSGYDAYLVGGCVRDMLMGTLPKDWDITTQALPQDIKEVFSEFKTIEIGIAHGTVGILIKNKVYEITTYRKEEQYINHRKPSNVNFIKDIRLDLSRRDFTINAMAYNESEGLLDFFRGREDVEARVIRSVGNPDQRFEEDALRIMRALRFASEKGFEIEAKTYEAMCNKKSLLLGISKERINEELCKLLMGSFADGVLIKYSAPMLEIFPKNLLAESDFQKVANVILKLIKLDLPLHFRIATLCAEIFLKGESLSELESWLKTMKFDKKTVEKTIYLIEGILLEIHNDKKCLKSNLNKYGELYFKDILLFRECYKDENLEHIKNTLEEIIDNKECFALSMLEINGDDLEALGFKRGRTIGNTLQKILEEVIEGKLENKKEILIETVKTMTQEEK